MRRSKYRSKPDILREILGKTFRFIGWSIVFVTGFALGAAVTFIPLSYLPGPIQTEFVNMRWVPYILLIALGVGVPAWRCQKLERLAGRQSQLSFALAARWIWAMVSSLAIAFWPLGLAVWFNSYDVEEYSIHDMKIVRVINPSSVDAGTEAAAYLLRDTATGRQMEFQFAEVWKDFVMMGSCVQVVVKHGRLGFDWVEDIYPCLSSNGPSP